MSSQPYLGWVEGDLPRRASSSDLEAQTGALVETLKERPGVWLKVESYPDDQPKAHRRREALLKHAVAGLEVRVSVPDVFARYVEDEEVES